jgi:hypothetical protein
MTLMTNEDEQVEIVRRPRVFRKRVNFRFQSFFEFNERFPLSSTKKYYLLPLDETQRKYALSILLQQQIQVALPHRVSDISPAFFATISKLADVV